MSTFHRNVQKRHIHTNNTETRPTGLTGLSASSGVAYTRFGSRLSDGRLNVPTGFAPLPLFSVCS